MSFRFIVACATLALCAPSMAQTVFVNSAGGAGKFTSINAALAEVNSNAASPDEIVIEDAGPFFETQILLDDTGPATPLTIRAATGIRPVVAVEANADGAISFLGKPGPVTIKDLILLPQIGAALTRPQAAIRIEGKTPGHATSVTLENLLITANDGANNPVGSLDGLTSPTFTPNTVHFRDEGVLTQAADTNTQTNIYLYDVIVTGLSGNQLSDGIRGFIDGAAGSEWIIGPGCVVSYCNTASATEVTSFTTNAAFQPGGLLGGLVAKVKGTQDKPVLLYRNNLNGIGITDGSQSIAHANWGLTEVEWCIIADNSGAGIRNTDNNCKLDLQNVTIVNNDGAYRGTAFPDAIFTFTNVIFAGNGDPAESENVVELIPGANPANIGIHEYNFEYSALPLTGPYTLNTEDPTVVDGIRTHPDIIVNTTGLVFSDPMFATLDPASNEYVMVTNPAYATAGPGGTPLIGAGSFGVASNVSDWNLY